MLNARNPHVDKSRAGTTVTIEKVARESEVLIESLKSLYTVLTPFWSAKHSTRTGGGALWSGADGPWPWAGRSAAWAQERCLPCVTPDGPQLWTGRSATWRQGRLPPPCWNLDLVP
jgi:hypothetical protein